MVRRPTPRTALLFRAYYGLLAISLVLSSLLINRHLMHPRNAASEIIMPAQRDPNAPRGFAPMINWGGQKR
jgi:hypothetical protein